jgi:carbamoyl-phosphate synthase large subunit
LNLLFSCIGKRGYIASYFREVLPRGSQIIGTSNTPWTAGLAACDRAILMPDIDNREYQRAVLELCHTHKITGALSFYDPDVMAFATMREKLLANGVVPIVPPLSVARVCFDKYETYEFLKQGGFDTPATFIDLAEVHRELDRGNLALPLVVKPRCGFGSHDTFVAKTRTQLDAFFSVRPDMIVQQFIAGPAFDFDICNDLDANPVSVVVWRKLRSTLGETEHVITVRDSKLLEIGVRLGAYVSQIGPMDVDFFWVNGRAWIIEMNPRFGGGYPVSHLAGANFPGIIVKMIRGEPVASQIGNYRDGIVMVKAPTVLGGHESTFWKDVMHLDHQPRIEVI